MKPFVRDNLKFVLKDKKILIGITGSIAAFKACDLVRTLRECGAMVRVVLTQGAENFVTPATLETLSGYPVLSHIWNTQSPLQTGTHHIDTARWADLILVAPATAHFIAKAAHGMADDLLSTEILAFNGPLLIAPAMNPSMFQHPAVQQNILLLQSRGVTLLGPANGMSACGEEGLGRMLEPDKIILEVASCFHAPRKKELFLITLGPTRSKIDPVRYLTNRSSGLMGASLCWAASQAGYSVKAICGPTDVELPPEIERVDIETAEEMASAVFQVGTDSHVFISTAAVLDWNIKNPSQTKLKKNREAPHLEFEKNQDILSTFSERKGTHPFIVGFAAETDQPVENGLQKLREKKCDAIFVNDISKKSHGFESPFNAGWWLTNEHPPIPLEITPKPALARILLSFIEKRTTHA